MWLCENCYRMLQLIFCLCTCTVSDINYCLCNCQSVHYSSHLSSHLSKPFKRDLAHIMWPSANQITPNMTLDGALNHLEHTLPYVGSKTIVTVRNKNAKVTLWALKLLGHTLLGITQFFFHALNCAIPLSVWSTCNYYFYM